MLIYPCGQLGLLFFNDGHYCPGFLSAETSAVCKFLLPRILKNFSKIFMGVWFRATKVVKDFFLK